METVILTKKGEDRVLRGEAGMTFVVDRDFHRDNDGGRVVHVRDYRYNHPGVAFQIWTLAPEDYVPLQ